METTDAASADQRGDDIAASEDEDFTDIELAELDQLERTESEPVLAIAEQASPPTASVPDGVSAEQLQEAERQADELRAYAATIPELDAAPLSEHVDFYQKTHTALQRALSDIDHA